MRHNPILLTDGYKPSHHKQYPPEVTHTFAFLESRGGPFDQTTFFGLQYLLKAYLAELTITLEDVDEAYAFFAEYFQNPTIFNREGWEYIVREHAGKLPLEVRAVPEGQRIPIKNALLTVTNTDPKVPWLPGYFEPLFVQLWYPISVATQSRAMKDIILANLQETGTPELISYKLHDFGLRGVSSIETAQIGGAAHLLNFEGTDTLPGIIHARRYYGKHMAGGSIPAAEHSTITSWRREREVDAYRNILKQFPSALVAVVSDSYDIEHACRELWGNQLKQDVLAREGTLVVRPDSGYPPEIVVRVLEILGEAFGYTLNQKGFKILDPHVRVIQGDGIDIDMLPLILAAMKAAGWSGDNVAFGSGGGLLQKLTRDTMKFAYKLSAICENGTWYDCYKDPITDPGKRSKAGRLKLVQDGADYRTVKEHENDLPNLLVPVFHNGEILREQTFDEIRKLAAL